MNLFAALKLYVIPDRKIGAPLSLLEQAKLSIDGGATAVQLRDKYLSGDELYREAVRIAELCKKKDVLFIVNDRVDVALASGADGVHLGQTDLPCHVVRDMVPVGFVVGVTVRTTEQAEKAKSDGADYLGVGALFKTGTKNNTTVIGPEGFSEIRKVTSLPLVAIGGIEKTNGMEPLKAGADGIALVSSVFAQKDITLACREFLSLCSL